MIKHGLIQHANIIKGFLSNMLLELEMKDGTDHLISINSFTKA